MERNIKMKALIAILALIVMTSAFAKEEYLCDLDITGGLIHCEKGDILYGKMDIFDLKYYCDIDTIHKLSLIHI